MTIFGLSRSEAAFARGWRDGRYVVGAAIVGGRGSPLASDGEIPAEPAPRRNGPGGFFSAR